MRKHLKLITDDEREDEVIGNTVFTDSQSPTVEKNVERVQFMRDWSDGNPGETWDRWVVGMGYVDFDDEDDYEARAADEMQRKLGEIDDEHLRKAGIEPAEVLA